MAWFLLSLLLSVGPGWSFAQSSSSFEEQCSKLATQTGENAQRLHQLFKLDWEHTMLDSPEFATIVGYPGQNHRWSDLSPEAVERRKRELLGPRKVLESIDRQKLTPNDQLNYDLFKRNTDNAIESSRFKGEYLRINQMEGVQQEIARILDLAPRQTVKEYEDILARLRAVPRLIGETIVLLKQGLAAGVTPPKITLRDVPAQIQAQMVDQKNALLRPFENFPDNFPSAERERLQNQAAQILKDNVIPAFAALHEFFVKTYLPGSRDSVAMTALPDGKSWYAHNVRVSTTTSLNPKQIHELGLEEVKRIHREMDQVMDQAGFKGTFEEFSKFLRTDPQFYFTDAESLVHAYRDICKRADPELAHLFGKLPRLPYGVKEIPGYAAKSQTTAYYESGSPSAGRPGWYMVNTYALETRPKWEMEALSLHEAVPGHHLQIALAQEMETAPEFRKNGGYTAFVEGWGLYSESLGPEMGFFKDPYMKFGQLTYEMWRAVRLVVDTGMHSMGWSRQEAIDYFKANASKTEHDITVEVDRYIVWPGQALAYKIGELKLKELRAYATRELGAGFNIRQFHDQVLDNGAMPLDLLEQRIKDWVHAEKSAHLSRTARE